jgi:hypothetical protein
MPSTNAIRKVLESEQLVDELAAIEHERWAHWQRYVHENCERQQDGSLVVPADLAARWQTQIETPYVGLTEREKDSDREQVRRYLPVIIDALAR